jgi:type 1 glutamine amidotransferase
VRREALIVWGGWEGHEPKQCAEVVEKLLKAEDFNVKVADSPSAFADSILGV